MGKSLRFNLPFVGQSGLAVLGIFGVYMGIELLTGTREHMAGYLLGIATAFVVLMPFVLLLSTATSMTAQAIGWGQTRRALFWDLQLLNGLSALGALVFALVVVPVSCRLSGEGVPLTPRLAALGLGTALVSGALGLIMGQCMVRWGGRGLIAPLAADLVLLAGPIAAVVRWPWLIEAALDFFASPSAAPLPLLAVLAAAVLLAALAGAVHYQLMRRATVR